ncbi:WecB/TagA/CpsF family glycosyltransferase [Gordonia sp. DT218]|uniref:WecB/TagA/CpsF family glycosyltransferase n=1 Tax=Gordonia sp. DT218 TaxID=3416659 RepID=UPI003CEE9388
MGSGVDRISAAVSPLRRGRTMVGSTGNFHTLHMCICCVDSDTAYDELVASLGRPAGPFVVSFVNAHAANLAWRTPALYRDLVSSDLVLRDGVGVQLALRVFGRPVGLNMNGTDFIPRLLKCYAGRRVALFGTQEPWLHNAREILTSQGLSVVAEHDGYSSVDTYVELAERVEPELVILAMGMPKQEAVAAALRRRLTYPVVVVNGGAILDFLGGRVDRAPAAVRRWGLEWAYRLYLEPHRLARRYLVGIPVFLIHLGAARMVVGHLPDSRNTFAQTAGVGIGAARLERPSAYTDEIGSKLVAAGACPALTGSGIPDVDSVGEQIGGDNRSGTDEGVRPDYVSAHNRDSGAQGGTVSNECGGKGIS